MAAFDLAPEIETARTGDVCAGLRLAPRRRVETEADRCFHQPVVGRVEFDLVDAITETVENLEFWRVCVRLKAPCDRLGAPAPLADLVQQRLGPRGAVPRDGLAKREVGFVQIVPGERRGLICDLVRTTSAGCRTLQEIHYRPVPGLPVANPAATVIRPNPQTLTEQTRVR